MSQFEYMLLMFCQIVGGTFAAGFFILLCLMLVLGPASNTPVGPPVRRPLLPPPGRGDIE